MLDGRFEGGDKTAAAVSSQELSRANIIRNTFNSKINEFLSLAVQNSALQNQCL